MTFPLLAALSASPTVDTAAARGAARSRTARPSAAQRGEQQPLPELWRRLAAASSPGRSSGLAALHPAGIPAVPSASQFQTGENCSRFLRGSEQSE